MTKTEGFAVIGIKQTMKVIRSGAAVRAYVAKDADKKLTTPFLETCHKHGVLVEFYDSRIHLGRAFGINVGAAVAVVTDNSVYNTVL